MVALAVMGVLVSLLLVGVQASRDAARRASCANKIRNQVFALQTYCSAQQRFPAGRKWRGLTEYSWCFEVLPLLDQQSLFNGFDPTKTWGDKAGNLALANTDLSIFRCASALTKYSGKTDFGGISGSLAEGISTDRGGIDNGILVAVGAGRPTSIRPADVTDGLSHTIAIAECTDRPQDFGGRWVSGFNCLSHNNGGINEVKGSDIHSFHSGGAWAAFADGHVQFLSQSIDEFTIAAICTRCGDEQVSEF